MKSYDNVSLFLDVLGIFNVKEIYEEIYNMYLLGYLDGLLKPFPIRLFAKQIGLEIEEIPLEVSIAGFLENNIIYVNDKDVGYRKNFTIAVLVAKYILKHDFKIWYRSNYYSRKKQENDEIIMAENLGSLLIIPVNLFHKEIEDFLLKNNLRFINEGFCTFLTEKGSISKSEYYNTLLLQTLVDRFVVSSNETIILLRFLGYIKKGYPSMFVYSNYYD